MPEVIIDSDGIVEDGLSLKHLERDAELKAYESYAILVFAAIIFYAIRIVPALALVTGFAAGFIIGRRDFKVALLCYVAVAPIIHPIFSVELPGLPLLTFPRLVFAGILAAWPFIPRNPKGAAFIGKRMFILFLVSILITAFISDEVSANLNTFFFYCVECYLLLFLLYRYTSDKQLDTFVRLLFISYVICMVFGAIEVIRGQSLFLDVIGDSAKVNVFGYSEQEDRIGGIHRIYSLFEHPFAFANFSAMVSLYGFGYYSVERSRKYLILFILAWFPVLFSFSRAALLFWFLMIGVVTFFFNARTRKTLLWSLPIIVLCLTIAVSYTSLGEYFSTYLNKDAIVYGAGGSSIESRISDIENSLIYFRQHVYFGFGDRTIRNLVSLQTLSDIGYLESNFIRLLLAFGGIGLFLFLGYMFLVMNKLLAKLKTSRGKDSKERMMSIVAIALIVGYIENSLHSSWINEQLLLVLINLPFMFIDKASPGAKV